MEIAISDEKINQEMPREKMMRYGPEILSESELLSLVLGTGTREMGVLSLSDSVISKFGGFGLPYASCEEMSSFCGLGPAKACRIAAAFELGKRYLQNKKTNVYLKPEDVWKRMQDLVMTKKEHFVVFLLDAKNQEIRREIVSMGTVNYSIVHPREVFEPAVRYLATSIIVSHNHPSGDTEPSSDDVKTTKRLLEAGRILGINLLDHVVVGRNGFVSLKERGFCE